MALIDEVPGVEISVVVNGLKAAEYDDPDPDGGAAQGENGQRDVKTIHKYIEAIDGAEFAIRWDVNSLCQARGYDYELIVDVNVDGEMRDAVFTSDLYRTTKIENRICWNTWNGKTVMSSIPGQFQRIKPSFQSIATVDDGRASRIEDEKKRAKNIGRIEVTLTWAFVRWGNMLAPTAARAPVGQKLEFSEKSFKGRAVSHGTKLNVVNGAPAPRLFGCDRDPAPIAKFVFTYKSREALKSELIIPRTPSPPPDAELGDLSNEQIRQLAREQLEQRRKVKDEERRRPTIKREHGATIDLTEDRPPRPFKTVKMEGGGQAIDLTEEDD